MSDTPRLALPLIASAQAQKHVTHNEALAVLDALVHLTVLDRDLAVPPVSPAEGAAYLVAAGATGDWAGHDGGIASWFDGAWAFYDAFAGLTAYVADEQRVIVHTGSDWQEIGASSDLQNVPGLGINTTITDTQRLSVKSDEVIFSHDDVTPGTGSMTAALNKADEAGDAGHAYKTDWSTRALAGLFGADDYAIKVSPDGASYRTGLRIDRTTGEVSFPNGSSWSRERLFADRTYHVDGASGSDADDGLSIATAFATIQKAVDAVAAIDMAGHAAWIQVAAGTYAGNVVLRDLVGGRCTITGDEVTPANVTVSPASGSAFQASGIQATWRLRGMKIEGAGVSFGIWANSAQIYFRNMDFGGIGTSSFQTHIRAEAQAYIAADGDYEVSGNVGIHWFVTGHGSIVVVGKTVALNGIPDFSTRFAQAASFGEILCNANSFLGAATGTRFYIGGKGIIASNGEGASYLPGDSAGLAAQDGLYI